MSHVTHALLLVLALVLVPAVLLLIIIPLALAGMPIALVVLPFLVTSFWPQRHNLRQAITQHEPPPRISVRPILAKT